MSASMDRIKFFLPCRYFQPRQHMNNMCRAKCLGILVKAFGFTGGAWEEIMRGQPQGFWIVCRPSQFGRFIVYRHVYGDCINGIRDLQPDVMMEPDLFGDIAEDVGICRRDVSAVARALGADNERNGWGPDVIDVSQNRHERHLTK